MKLNLILIISCLVLTACGGSGGSSSTEMDPTPVPETPDVSELEDEGGEEPINEPDETSPEDLEQSAQPNIIFILSDDQGIDASAQYSYSVDVPNTPILNGLANDGLVFDNAWVTPACSTTRAALLTGQYGIHSGVSSVPGNLATSSETVQTYLKSQDATEHYQTGFFGKWHLGNNAGGPTSFGIDYFAGNMSNIDDYYSWELTLNDEVSISTEYHTRAITNQAIDWIASQNTSSSWFAWVAYSAPHSPFHLPPDDLHSRTLSGSANDISSNSRDYYLAAIEAMDSEIGRLLDSLPEETRNNTVIFFIGDNGTPAQILDTSVLFQGQSKNSLYEGGVRAPFVVSGAGVTRKGEREERLVNATDMFATIAQIAGLDLDAMHDSESFAHLLEGSAVSGRDYNFVHFTNDSIDGYAIRNLEFKLIEWHDGSQELYQLSEQSIETEDLIAIGAVLNTAQSNAFELLNNRLDSILGRADDAGPESPVDITNATLTSRSVSCADYANDYVSDVVDVNEAQLFQGDLSIAVVGNKCVFDTNAIPNHDFNDGDAGFPNQVSAQSDQFQVTTAPSFAAAPTELSLQIDNALLLNGVKVDLLAAGCFGIGNGKVGCNDMSTPWRYDPMHPVNGFRVDTHNAHAQPDGTYHYHGTPNAFYHQTDVVESPVIGFAADGFPIFGPFYTDGEGVVRKAVPSYRLKSGNRPMDDESPGGGYDGSFLDDYEYVQGLGDLDVCNGMTVNDHYGYYITDDYPYVLACFQGTPDASFYK
ncbi:sulfatase-like hydrolase/transferase [Echinimonas agarilytica]|uniref:Sulfatase-like hydrolase/transferase n=1 Tax=Echinimonas agarilytica TaxID=1215918 RepID=A0AA41W552_9GAMM|nr:sulfatase-like hydrolase/transferase [Echinimonas agarilytica]MCM2678508.1 sulfatase-like hydrolase/transferase [Echinimonas agarilytica]